MSYSIVDSGVVFHACNFVAAFQLRTVLFAVLLALVRGHEQSSHPFQLPQYGCA